MKIPFFGNKKKAERKPKSKTREWVDAIVFAVIAATLIRWATLEAFVIPTPSMENSLLVGDYLFVSKLHYGPRTPKTPLQIPLTHRRIWGTEIPSYLDWIQLPQYRLPSFTEVKRNDVVVFNYPAELEYPLDLRENYIKRAVAIAGDTLMIKDAKVYINGEEMNYPEGVQFSYAVRTAESVRERVFEQIGIWEYNRIPAYGYYINTTPERAAELEKLPFVESIVESPNLANRSLEEITEADWETDIYPRSKENRWNKNFYGPLWIPKEGMTIALTEDNFEKYAFTIENYEGLKDVYSKNGQLYIDGQVVTEYTFKQNYYFMMGDNRHNSLDSRYWGFVPEDHVVGKALFIWMSMDPQKGLFSRIRWSRLFNGIH